MIFAHTIDAVLSGQKSQTCRLCYVGDRMGLHGPAQTAAVLDRDGRPRWIVGHVYAVQRERCHAAEGYIRLVTIRRLEDPTSIDDDFARLEGVGTREKFLEIWHRMHRSQPVQPVWVLGFVFVGRKKPARRRAA